MADFYPHHESPEPRKPLYWLAGCNNPELRALLTALGVTSPWQKVVIEIPCDGAVTIYVKKPARVVRGEVQAAAETLAGLGREPARQDVADVVVTDRCEVVAAPLDERRRELSEMVADIPLVQVVCDRCKGMGCLPPTRPVVCTPICPDCGGHGYTLTERK
jgi:hypothetical protein